MSNPLDAREFAALCAALADVSVPFAVPIVAGFDDDGLLAAQRTVAEIRRRADAAAAVIAGEIAHRSRRELGDAGLARRLGARTPEILVARVAGTSAREATSLVRVGAVMTIPTMDAAAPTPWLASVVAAVRAGGLSVDAADAIRVGLGVPDDFVSGESLRVAADALLVMASSLTIEQLAVRARDERAELDAAQVRDREKALRDRRFLRVVPQSDGMTRLAGLLDPESAAIVIGAYDAATSPRRGGPRFVDPDSVDRVEQLLADERTIEQIALDTFVDLVRLGTEVAPDALLGAKKPAVRVLVTERDLAARHGVARIEGQTDPISIDTVERHACEAGIVPLLFDDALHVVNLGRSQRLFTARQRMGLAARDGGCLFPGCDRPPSWCEAHHINEWKRDGGRTDVADGVLLCRHHHLLTHNNGWRVTRRQADYFLVPPPDLGAARTPIPAPSKSVLMRRMRSQQLVTA
ncbi:MAG TPA: DUF222 domain-containing protein [Pseudolysinimonas sp.]|nr:DUF222 domain-containing protein [Pseudolysinimonas sp.]